MQGINSTGYSIQANPIQANLAPTPPPARARQAALAGQPASASHSEEAGSSPLSELRLEGLQENEILGICNNPDAMSVSSFMRVSQKIHMEIIGDRLTMTRLAKERAAMVCSALSTEAAEYDKGWPRNKLEELYSCAKDFTREQAAQAIFDLLHLMTKFYPDKATAKPRDVAQLRAMSLDLSIPQRNAIKKLFFDTQGYCMDLDIIRWRGVFCQIFDTFDVLPLDIYTLGKAVRLKSSVLSPIKH